MGPQTIAAFAFFGLIFVVPLVYLIQRHQRTIMEGMHLDGDSQRRIQMLEQEVRELKAMQNELMIRVDDQRDLALQLNGARDQSPPAVDPTVVR